jgi:sterol desaturase/sphingolipid hydroxylase (fatty acid hydroxylase superfamily)
MNAMTTGNRVEALSTTGRLLRRAAFPATMALAYGAYFLQHASGVPPKVSPYFSAVFAAAIVMALEYAIPYEREWLPRWDDVKHDFLFMATSQVLLPLALAWFVSAALLTWRNGSDVLGHVWPHQSPVAAQLVLMLISVAFLRYWLHVAAHNTKTLWTLHAIHHSPKKLYWLNVGRFHPIEKSLQFLLDAFPFIVLGVGEEVLGLYLICFAVVGFFEHSNVDARFGVLNYIFSSPELHRWHHSRLIQESNNNYGNTLMVWDLVFGTYFFPRDRHVAELGLINRAYPMGFFSQMRTPFVPGLDKQSKGVADAS